VHEQLYPSLRPFLHLLQVNEIYELLSAGQLLMFGVLHRRMLFCTATTFPANTRCKLSCKHTLQVKDYGRASYWDRRYEEEVGLKKFEWYQSYDSLQPILENHLGQHGRVLQVRILTGMALI
jgi:hypothetical protein